MLNPRNASVPVELQHAQFTIIRQSLDHNEIDFEAVMASKSLLREWSHSDWPEDDFTPEQNRDDLAGHIEEYDADIAYGFSVLEPDGQRLLGSLYLEPVAPFIENYLPAPELKNLLDGCDVRVEYWLREGTSESLEREFIEAVLEWLRQDWWFGSTLLGARRGMQRRRQLYADLGFEEVGSMTSLDGERVWHFYRPK